MIKENRQLPLGVLHGLDTHALNLRVRPPLCWALGGPWSWAGWLEPLGKIWGKEVPVDPP